MIQFNVCYGVVSFYMVYYLSTFNGNVLLSVIDYSY